MSLFKDTADFCTVYPALKSTSWRMVLPSIELVESSMFRDQVLGHSLYDDLHDAYQASIAESPTAMPAALASLNERVRKAVAFLSAFEALPQLNVNFSSTGATASETDRTKRAPMWAVHEHLAAALRHGHGYLDQLVAFLAENESDYAAWSEAPFRKEVRESLIPTMAVASRYMKLGGTWLLHQLRPAMRKIQRGPVRSIIGDTDYDTLLAHVHADAVTEDEQDLLEEARPAILNLALASQVIALGLTIDLQGVCTWESATSGGQTSGGKQPAEPERINALVRDLTATGNAHLEELRKLCEPDEPEQGFTTDPDAGILFTG